MKRIDIVIRLVAAHASNERDGVNDVVVDDVKYAAKVADWIIENDRQYQAASSQEMMGG